MVQIHVPVKMGVHHFRRHGVHGFFNELIDLYMGHGIQPHIRQRSEMHRFHPQQGIGSASLLLLLRQDLRQAEVVSVLGGTAVGDDEHMDFMPRI